MFVWTQLQGQSLTPTPLLSHLAGEFADRLAAIWPAPHGEFLTASAAQRHALCLGLAKGAEPAAVRAALSLPLRRAVRALIPMAPDGLLRALPRLGETAWKADDYGVLLEQLALQDAGKILRHAEVIDADMVRTLAAYPGDLLRAGVTRLSLTPLQSGLMAEAWQVVRDRDGPDEARRVAERWGRLRSAKALFEAVADDLMKPMPAAPFPDTPRLKALATKAAMRDAAARYSNCLRTRIRSAVEGWSAFYEWHGKSPAIVEIYCDSIFGWRLDEVKLKRNATMPAEDRGELLDELRGMGVHVGRPAWELIRACEDALDSDFELQPLEQSVGAIFGD